MGVAFGIFSDICLHLNKLNILLQGKDIFFQEAILKLNAFQIKIQLYREQFENHDYTNFSVFGSADCLADINMDFYICILDKLIFEFSTSLILVNILIFIKIVHNIFLIFIHFLFKI